RLIDGVLAAVGPELDVEPATPLGPRHAGQAEQRHSQPTHHTRAVHLTLLGSSPAAVRPHAPAPSPGTPPNPSYPPPFPCVPSNLRGARGHRGAPRDRDRPIVATPRSSWDRGSDPRHDSPPGSGTARIRGAPRGFAGSAADRARSSPDDRPSD